MSVPAKVKRKLVRHSRKRNVKLVRVTRTHYEVVRPWGIEFLSESVWQANAMFEKIAK